MMLACVAIVAAAFPAPAEGARRSGRDADHAVRLTLDGRVLTATISGGSREARRHVRGHLYGKRVDFLCGSSFRLRTRPLSVVRTWPRGRDRVRVRFRRDISRGALWCLLEAPRGGDIALVSFLQGERKRLVAKGRAPSGAWWRLAGWRGLQDAPCVGFRSNGFDHKSCFNWDAEREATLGVVLSKPRCPGGDGFVYGATSRRTAAVDIGLRDGRTVKAALYPRPPGSLVRAQFFMAVLPDDGPGISGVRALDSRGRVLGKHGEGMFVCNGSSGG